LIREIEDHSALFEKWSPSFSQPEPRQSDLPQIQKFPHLSPLDDGSLHKFVVVNTGDDIDVGVANTACVPSWTSSGANCTLRLAMSVCMQSSFSCELYLLPASTIILTKGEIENYAGQSFNITIYGQGATITTTTRSRFLKIWSGEFDVNTISLFDVTLTKFGSPNIVGGVFYFIGVSGGIFSRVLFSENEGSVGGVMYTADTSNLEISNSAITSNIARSGGGAFYLLSGNFGWKIIGNFFRGNSAGSGGVFYLGTENNDWTIENSVFYENNATYDGGVFYFMSANNGWSFHGLNFSQKICSL